ncbi:hypothetical protein EYC84_009810 [Monilinia fructicola]|uniref:Uncharacterized protein n=1 Tax=Monilinia fructicola TaxID=38448 RepID=A0A5M9JDM5_MONFR|nr:hypothetical protein EYC84_009810 [Monilinia fructicola]
MKKKGSPDLIYGSWIAHSPARLLAVATSKSNQTSPEHPPPSTLRRGRSAVAVDKNNQTTSATTHNTSRSVKSALSISTYSLLLLSRYCIEHPVFHEYYWSLAKQHCGRACSEAKPFPVQPPRILR